MEESSFCQSSIRPHGSTSIHPAHRSSRPEIYISPELCLAVSLWLIWLSGSSRVRSAWPGGCLKSVNMTLNPAGPETHPRHYSISVEQESTLSKSLIQHIQVFKGVDIALLWWIYPQVVVSFKMVAKDIKSWLLLGLLALLEMSVTQMGMTTLLVVTWFCLLIWTLIYVKWRPGLTLYNNTLLPTPGYIISKFASLSTCQSVPQSDLMSVVWQRPGNQLVTGMSRGTNSLTLYKVVGPDVFCCILFPVTFIMFQGNLMKVGGIDQV